MQKSKICAQICQDLKLRGHDENDLRYVRMVLSPLGYTDSKYENLDVGGNTSALENLNESQNNINIPLPDKRFQELKAMPNDTVTIMAQFKLSKEQVKQLSPAEQRELMEARRKVVSSVIAQGKEAAKDLEEIRKELGIPDDSGLRSKRKKTK